MVTMRKLLFALGVVLACGVAGDPCRAQGVVDWDDVLRASKVTWPEVDRDHDGAIAWRSDLEDAFAEARDSGRPLFVTLRCLPCKQCSSFDKDVLEGGPLLAPLLRQFVTVRLTDAKQIDLTRLPALGFQDFDLSWWGYCLSPTAQLYSVFGGRDHVSDSTRISAKALANNLHRVLDHHYDARRKQWNIDGPGVASDAEVKTPLELPGFASFQRGNAEYRGQSCLHCHQVADVVRQPAIDAGTFDKLRGVSIWPLPENVGLTLDRDDGLRVLEIEAKSPAQKIGLLPGDQLVVANGRRLFGQADFRGVLHRNAEPTGTVSVMWLRNGIRKVGQLVLEHGWRETVLDWRMSISQGNIGVGPTFFPLRSKHPKAPKNSMAIAPFFGRGANRRASFRAGMRPNQVIVAVDGQKPRLHGRAFLVWFRKRYEPGQRVVFTVLDKGKTRDIPLVLPKR